jgi:excisionase family DNA binding protein
MAKLSRINDYYTIETLAELLGIAPATLYSYISRKGIKPDKIGTTPLVKLSDLGQFKARIDNVRKLLEDA